MSWFIRVLLNELLCNILMLRWATVLQLPNKGKPKKKPRVPRIVFWKYSYLKSFQMGTTGYYKKPLHILLLYSMKHNLLSGLETSHSGLFLCRNNIGELECNACLAQVSGHYKNANNSNRNDIKTRQSHGCSLGVPREKHRFFWRLCHCLE